MNSLTDISPNGSAQFHIHKSGALYGVTPPETGFGFLYFAHMIPPIQPEHTLMLGYGHGVVADLMRKVWGQCKITAVDFQGYQGKNSYNEFKMEVMDAKNYVWDATNSIIKKRFDYIAIDIWDGMKVPDFVFETEFAIRLREMSKKYVCMNITEEDVPRTKSFYDYGFKFERVVPIEGNRIMWWSIEEKK